MITISDNLINIDFGGIHGTRNIIIEGCFKSFNKIYIIATKTVKSIRGLYELSNDSVNYLGVILEGYLIAFHRAGPGNKIVINNIEGVKMNIRKLLPLIENKTFKWKSSQ